MKKILLLMIVLSIASCKKEKKDPEPETEVPVTPVVTKNYNMGINMNLYYAKTPGIDTAFLSLTINNASVGSYVAVPSSTINVWRFIDGNTPYAAYPLSSVKTGDNVTWNYKFKCSKDNGNMLYLLKELYVIEKGGKDKVVMYSKSTPDTIACTNNIALKSYSVKIP